MFPNPPLMTTARSSGLLKLARHPLVMTSIPKPPRNLPPARSLVTRSLLVWMPRDRLAHLMLLLGMILENVVKTRILLQFRLVTQCPILRKHCIVVNWEEAIITTPFCLLTPRSAALWKALITTPVPRSTPQGRSLLHPWTSPVVWSVGRLGPLGTAPVTPK